jgi:hypothetical protein
VTPGRERARRPSPQRRAELVLHRGGVVSAGGPGGACQSRSVGEVTPTEG